MVVQITEDAKKHLISIGESQGKMPKLGIRGGGCAGFSYDWATVTPEEIQSDDEIIKLNDDIDFVIDGMSIMYLFGSTVDLKKDVFGTVLEIQSPAAQSSCGCGESINFDMDFIDKQWQENS